MFCRLQSITKHLHDCAASMHLANETRVSFERKDDARAYTHEGTPAENASSIENRVWRINRHSNIMNPLTDRADHLSQLVLGMPRN